MGIERRKFLRIIGAGAAAFGANLLHLPDQTRKAEADVLRSGEGGILTPEQQILTFSTEVLAAGNLLPGDVAPPITKSSLKSYRRYEMQYKSKEGDREVFAALNTSTEGQPVFMAVYVMLSRVTETAAERLKDERIVADFAENFTPLADPAVALPWIRRTSPHLIGNPLTVEKNWISSGGYMESRGAVLVGEGQNRQALLMAAKAFQGSKQFSNNTAFIPT